MFELDRVNSLTPAPGRLLIAVASHPFYVISMKHL